MTLYAAPFTHYDYTPMPILLLIRHATNDFVKTGRLPGHSPGIHLNEEGRAQATALGKTLATRKIDAVYASHLERAIETALYVAQPHGLPINIRPGLADIDNGDLTGRTIKEVSEDEKTKDLWKVVIENPSEAHFPNGEGMLAMQQRFVAALEAIAAAHPDEKAPETAAPKAATTDDGGPTTVDASNVKREPAERQADRPPTTETQGTAPSPHHPTTPPPPSKTIAIVAHSDVIKSALAHFLGMPFNLFQRLGTSPASISTIMINTDEKTGQQHIMVQNVNYTV